MHRSTIEYSIENESRPHHTNDRADHGNTQCETDNFSRNLDLFVLGQIHSHLLFRTLATVDELKYSKRERTNAVPATPTTTPMMAQRKTIPPNSSATFVAICFSRISAPLLPDYSIGWSIGVQEIFVNKYY